MPDNDDPQNPYDLDSLTAPTQSESGNDSTSLWYYRPSSGMNDWAAQMNGSSRGDNANTTPSTVKSQDLQFVDPSTACGDSAAGSQADMQSLQDTYNAQMQANAQFGQSHSLTLDTTSDNGNVPDFMTKQLLRTQQSVGSRNDGNDSSATPNEAQTQPQVTPPTDTHANVTAYGYGRDNAWAGHANGGATIAYTNDPNRPRDTEGNPQAHLGTGTYDDPTSMAKHPDNPLPLGSRVYVQGVGWFIIEDVSGRTRDNGTPIPVNSYDMWSGHSTQDQRNNTLANPDASVVAYPRGTAVPQADQQQGPSQMWIDFVNHMRQQQHEN